MIMSGLSVVELGRLQFISLELDFSACLKGVELEQSGSLNENEHRVTYCDFYMQLSIQVIRPFQNAVCMYMHTHASI